jgi:hypothetical protein
MNERRNNCDREVLLRGMLFSAASRTLLFAASAFEGPKYLVTDILIDVSSRSPQSADWWTAVSDIRSGVDTGAERCGSSAPHKVRLQQIHTLLAPMNMQGPSALRSFVTERPIGRVEEASPGISSPNRLASRSNG